MSLPTMTATGRLIDDPELRYSAAGNAVARLRLAFNARKKDDSGNWTDGDSFFVTGTLFGESAEHAAESLTRSMEVVVSGRLRTEKWESKEGEKRSATALLIDSIGPSLRWATAKVTKTERSGGQQAASKPAGDDPWAATGSADNFSQEPPF